MAASTYLAQVQQLYIAYFGRPADPIGLQYWASAIDAANGSIAAVQAGFSASAESQALFGNKSTIDKVTAIYQNAFGRAPEPAGLAYWVAQLDSGKVTQAQASWTIQQSAGAGDAAAVQNKLTAAQAFTAQIDTTAEIVGYQGNAAAASARTFLSSVSADNATATAAVAGSATALANAITAQANAGATTVALTTAVDTLTGTSGNDVFVGVSSATATSNTISVADQINGGAGTDTLKVFVDATATALNTISLPQLNSIENLYFNSGTISSLDVSTITGVTGLELDKTAAAAGSSTLKTAAGSAVTIDNYAGGAVASVIVLDGANKLTVNNVTATTGSNTFQIGAASSTLTAFTVNATGANSAIALTNPSNLVTTLSVTGDKGVAITEALVNLTTVNASANTGGVTLNANAVNALTFTGGTGNDTVNFAAGTLGAGDTLDGGAGTDTLGVNEATYTTAVYTAINAAKNFEVLSVNSAGSLDVSLVTSIAQFGVSSVGTGTVQFNNAAAATKYTIDTSATNAHTVSIFNKLAADGSTVTLDNEDATLAAHSLAGLTTTAASLAIASTGKAGNTVTTLSVKDGSTVTITGSADFGVGTLAGASTTGIKVDGSAATGVLTLTGNNTAYNSTAATSLKLQDTLIGGVKADTLISTANGDVLTGGAGNDTFNVVGAKANTGFNVVTTVTDLTKGDIVKFDSAVVTGSTITKVDVSAAADLATALDSLAANTVAGVTWGVFQGNTYVVGNDGTTGLGATDTVVKLSGALDLSTSTLAAGTGNLVA